MEINYIDALKGLTLHDLHKEFASTSASMRIDLTTTPIALAKKTDGMAYHLSRLIIINNEIRKRESDAN